MRYSNNDESICFRVSNKLDSTVGKTLTLLDKHNIQLLLAKITTSMNVSNLALLFNSDDNTENNNNNNNNDNKDNNDNNIIIIMIIMIIIPK